MGVLDHFSDMCSMTETKNALKLRKRRPLQVRFVEFRKTSCALPFSWSSGISFYRFIAPIILMSCVATGIGLVFSEVAPPANAKRLKLLAGRSEFQESARYNFAFANDAGRVYRIYALDTEKRRIERVEIEERGSQRRAGLLIAADSGHWHHQRGWLLRKGQMHVLPNDSIDLAFGFAGPRQFTLLDRHFADTVSRYCSQALDRVRLRIAAAAALAEAGDARMMAEQANGAKTLFLRAMSHELRTPLNAIAGPASRFGQFSRF